MANPKMNPLKTTFTHRQLIKDNLDEGILMNHIPAICMTREYIYHRDVISFPMNEFKVPKRFRKI